MLTLEQADRFKLSHRKDRYEYLGILDEYQTVARSYNGTMCYTKLNPRQHFLFKRVLHGLNMYEQVEIAKMHWDKKRRITKVWKRSQHVINEWKQYISYKQVQPIFRIFAKSELGKALYETPFQYLPDYKNKMTFKELGITYEDLILKFIGSNLLPTNFYLVK